MQWAILTTHATPQLKRKSGSRALPRLRVTEKSQPWKPSHGNNIVTHAHSFARTHARTKRIRFPGEDYPPTSDIYALEDYKHVCST